MNNDLNQESPTTPVVPSDPLVAFRPQTAATEGAPFYTDPSLAPVEPEAIPQALSNIGQDGMSPFLMEDIPPVSVPTPSMPAQPGTGATQKIMDFVPSSPGSGTLNVNQAEIALSETVPWSLKQFGRRSWWLVLALLGLVLLLGGGLWWLMRPTSIEPVVVETPVNAAPPLPAPASIAIEPTTKHYSVGQPNLLSFDTETVTASAMRTEFLKVALSIKGDALQKPVEFLIRDQNYNPLAFARFAYLLGLGLSTDMLAALDEQFSLYFSLDQGVPRIGFVVSIKNSEAFAVALARDEPLLPQALEPLFLDTTTAPKTGLSFRSGLYREQPVRYVNIDPSINLSLDSAVRGSRWFIGTSQQTLRALLDQTALP